MPKLAGLQLLRAFAAVMVLIGHAIAEAEHSFALSLKLNIIPWTRGVDIFFVISGFIITLSAARFAKQPIAFLWRRSLRVVPLYYFFTTLMVITLFALPNGTKDTVFDVNQMISSYIFFPYERGDGRIAPILSLGWTLNYEMAFYVLCAFSLMFARPSFALSILLVAIGFSGLIYEFSSPPLHFWSNSIILEFAYGIVLAKIYQSGWIWPKLNIALLLFGFGLALLVGLHATGLPRFIAAGIPAALIVGAGTLFCPVFQSRWQIFGDASYALYLSHRFVLRIVTLLMAPILPASGFGAWFYVASVCVLSLSVSLVVHLWLERPLMTFAHKRVAA